jgi:hypothetical protein
MPSTVPPHNTTVEPVPVVKHASAVDITPPMLASSHPPVYANVPTQLSLIAALALQSPVPAHLIATDKQTQN